MKQDHLRVPRRCPRCDYATDATGPLTTDERQRVLASAGDVQLCLRCGMVEVFTAAGQLVPMSGAEWAALDIDDRRALLQAEDARRRVMGT